MPTAAVKRNGAADGINYAHQKAKSNPHDTPSQTHFLTLNPTF